MKEPAEPSPKDGSKIDWRIIVGQGKGTVHLGVSGPGFDFWRYEYGSGRGIEPALPAEAQELEKLLKEQAERDQRDGQTTVETGRRR